MHPWQDLAPVPNSFTEGPEQPRRVHPFAVALTPDSKRALVTARGNELEPGRELVIIDVAARTIERRLEVGARPVEVVVHPAGRHAVVLSQFSIFAAVVDLERFEVVASVEVGRYAERLAFAPDGGRMFVTSRASDALAAYALDLGNGDFSATLSGTVAAGINPGAIGVAPGGAKLYVADDGGLAVRVFDAAGLSPIAVIPMNAPVFDLVAIGRWIVAATLGDTNGLPCQSDADYPGEDGDGVFDQTTDRTCGRGFADIQNDIAFIDPATDEIAIRYTSDTAEISEADREGDHLPELMKVTGSLPLRIAVTAGGSAYVSMGASFEVVEMVVPTSTSPLMEMPRAFETGFAPRGVAVDGAGETLVVANALSDTVSIIDIASGQRDDIPLDASAPPFPATDAEIGELFFSTSRYATDGDQSCLHCHPDGDSDGKSWGVSLVRAYGRRATLPARNLRGTKPLLVEGVFEETDFSLEMESISFRPDFHDSSYTLQVARRDAFYRDVSRVLFGREVGFDAMVRHLGAFLMVEPRLLPSPFAADTAQVEQGRALFFRFDVGCSICHPSPHFASPELFEGMTTIARYDRPQRSLDPDISTKFLENAKDGFFNANSLRGVWDRRGALLHDGRARTVRETLLTPGHPCLKQGEKAFNEFHGEADSHAGIARRSCEQIDALVAFLLTLD